VKLRDAFSLLGRGLRQYPLLLLGLAILASWPTEILGEAMGWSMMDAGGYLAEALWFPVFMLCQLAMLRRMGRGLNPSAAQVPLRPGILGSALAAEILLSLRFCVVIFLWALPSLLLLSLIGLEPLWARIVLAMVAAASAFPCVLWILRRLFTPAVILWQGLGASAAIDESARLSQGKMRQVLWPLIALNGIGLILEGVSGLLESGGLVALPLSFILGNASIALAYRILTL